MKKFGITLIAVFGLVSISSAQLGDSPRPIKKELKKDNSNITAIYRAQKNEPFKLSRKENIRNMHIERKAPLKQRTVKPIRHMKVVR